MVPVSVDAQVRVSLAWVEAEEVKRTTCHHHTQLLSKMEVRKYTPMSRGQERLVIAPLPRVVGPGWAVCARDPGQRCATYRSHLRECLAPRGWPVTPLVLPPARFSVSWLLFLTQMDLLHLVLRLDS